MQADLCLASHGDACGANGTSNVLYMDITDLARHARLFFATGLGFTVELIKSTNPREAAGYAK